MKRRIVQSFLLTLLILACAIGGFNAWFRLRTPNYSRATLVRLQALDFSSAPCFGGNPLSNGLMIDFRVEWETPDDLVAVLNTLNQQGWRPVTHITSSVELLPARQDTFDLWLLQARVFRGISLSYTPKRLTRSVESTAVMLCPL